jgi:hypothetical protein
MPEIPTSVPGDIVANIILSIAGTAFIWIGTGNAAIAFGALFLAIYIRNPRNGAGFFKDQRQ